VQPLTDEEPQAHAPDSVATGGEHVGVDEREERGRERELEPAEHDAPDRRRHDGRRERGGLARATGCEGHRRLHGTGRQRREEQQRRQERVQRQPRRAAPPVRRVRNQLEQRDAAGHREQHGSLP